MIETISGILGICILIINGAVLAFVVAAALPARVEKLPRRIYLCIFGVAYLLISWLFNIASEVIALDGFYASSLKSILLMLLTYGLMSALFKGDLRLRVFLLCCFWAVQQIGIFVADGVWRVLSEISLMVIEFSSEKDIEIWAVAGLVLMVAVHGGTLFVTMRYIVKRLKVSFLRKQEFVYLMLPCLVGIAVTQSLRAVLLLDKDFAILLSPLYTIPVPLAGVLMLLLLAASVKLYKELDQLHADGADKRVLEKQVAGLHERVREVETVYGEVRGLRHDMAGHLQNIRALMEQPEPHRSELNEYLCRMETQLEAMQMPYATGNPITDVILRQKTAEAHELGAAFEIDFAFPTELGIDAYDIAVILGNALDNALEACAAMCDGEMDIHLYAHAKGRMFFIEVENSFNGNIRFEGELPASGKEDGTLHGMGLSNIRRCAQKYMGDIQITLPDKGRRFHLFIMLQGKKQNP